MMDNDLSQQEGAAGREAQFAVGRVYRMPFRERRVFDEQTGRPRYVPLETEPVTTGVALVDEWLRWLGAGAEGGHIGGGGHMESPLRIFLTYIIDHSRRKVKEILFIWALTLHKILLPCS